MEKKFSPKYIKYINSDAWRAMRSRVLERDSCRCRDCGHTSPRNHVHHLTYARLGRERLDDLVTLCKACHDAVHHGSMTVSRKKAVKPIPAKKKKRVKKPKDFMRYVSKEISKRNEARSKAKKEYESGMDAMYPGIDWRSW